MGKFNFGDSPVKKMAEELRDSDNTPAQVRQSVPAVQVVQDPPTPYNEVLKNVGAKIPYSIYDRLERIKRQSERTGIRSEKRNIGDLIAQAVKEFVEKYDV